MNGWLLLAIGLLGFTVVVGFTVALGLRAWRLVKRGATISREIAPLADGLARQAAALSLRAEQAGRNAAQIAESMERLRASAERLRILTQAFSEGLEPYSRLFRFFEGWG
jgi:site-specific recombinase